MRTSIVKRSLAAWLVVLAATCMGDVVAARPPLAEGGTPIAEVMPIETVVVADDSGDAAPTASAPPLDPAEASSPVDTPVATAPADDPIPSTGDLPDDVASATAVVITVPGPVSAGFELGAPSIEIAADTTTVIVPIENSGNARVRPQGTIVISDDAGNPVVSIPVAMDSVYAWHATTMQSTLSQPLPEGTYTVSVDLVDEASGATATLPGTIVLATIVGP